MTHTFTPPDSTTSTILSSYDEPRGPGLYSPDDEYVDYITWSLPKPSKGLYQMQIVVHGPSKDTDNYICLLAWTRVK